MAYTLRFPAKDIQALAERYWDYGTEEDRLREIEIENEISLQVRNRGYYTQPEFLKLARWKTKRTRRRCEKNSEEFVQEVTRIALGSKNERIHIESLMLLDGVGWPTASVLLHFGSRGLYPILDFRALWSLTTAVPKQYDFDFWWAYTLHCRSLADKHKVSMRILDRALWTYSRKPKEDLP